jgi:hypothetical protein
MWRDSLATSAVADARPADEESRHAAWRDQKGYFLQF